MNRSVIIAFVVLLSYRALSQETSVAEFRLHPYTTVKLVTLARGIELLSAPDGYVEHLGKFDIQSKVQNPKATTREAYLKNAGKQVREWTVQDIKLFDEIMVSANEKMRMLGLALNFPPEIEVVKTTGREEGGAGGYTRMNYVVLNKASIQDFTFVHELYHILTRHNPGLQDSIFKTMGFTRCNRIQYPASMYDMRLTNPDAPVLEHYITVTYMGKPMDAVMVIYSEDEYQGGSLFEYIQVGLMAIDGPDWKKKPRIMADGNPLIITFDEATNLYEQIGRNTDYNIHPEETAASHFTVLLFQKKVEHPGLIEKMKTILKAQSK